MRKIELMHSLMGLSEDGNATCKTCVHLVKRQYSKTYYKCECYSLGSSESSDWKVSNRACGLYNKLYFGKPIICMARTKRRKEEVFEGQLTLFAEVK